MRTRILLDAAPRARHSRVIVASEQDVEPMLEANAAARAEPQRGDLRRVASIPNVILVRWLNEEYARGNVDLRLFSAEFDRIVRTKLDDPEWRFLRVDK
jgi:hypothetical protein